MHIITLTKNSEKTIQQTIDSIQNQTLKSVNWIILDESSTDNTLKKIQKSKINSEVISVNTKGLFDAYNKALSLLHERKVDDIILFLHSDDIIFDNHTLEDVEKIFLKYENDCLYGNVVFFKNNPSIFFRKWNSNNKKKQIELENKIFKVKQFEKKDFRFAWSFPHTSLFFHSKIVDKIPYYYDDLPTSSDFGWSINLLLNKSKLNFIFYNNYLIKMKAGGTSTKFKNIVKNFFNDFVVIKRIFYKSFFDLPLCILILFSKKIIKLKQFF